MSIGLQSRVGIRPSGFPECRHPAEPATGIRSDLTAATSPTFRLHVSHALDGLTKDPIGYEGGATNLYRYVKNDPVNAVDPMGLTEQDIVNAINYVRGTSYGRNFDQVDFYIDDLIGKNAVGWTDPGFLGRTEMVFDDQYLKKLNDVELKDLLDTTFHEAIHVNQGWLGSALLSERRHDMIGEEAKRATDAHFSKFKEQFKYNNTRTPNSQPGGTCR